MKNLFVVLIISVFVGCTPGEKTPSLNTDSPAIGDTPEVQPEAPTLPPVVGPVIPEVEIPVTPSPTNVSTEFSSPEVVVAKIENIQIVLNADPVFEINTQDIDFLKSEGLLEDGELQGWVK